METGPAENLETLWNQALNLLQAQLSKQDFDTWIQPLEPLATSGKTLEFRVPNHMFATWVADHFLDKLTHTIGDVAGFSPELRFICDPADPQGKLFIETAEPAATKRKVSSSRSPGRLIDGYEFENFVVGPNNQFARAAAMAIAKQPGTLYNPLFMYGGVGLGKTHLANAVGHAIVEHDPAARVMFASSDGFTNQLVEAISKNKAQEFKNRVRRLDVLIVDDVQFLSGRERTQEEFFHIFNVLYEQGRQIILTSDKAPVELDGIEQRLCNRFGWGLVADIQAPDTETRRAILERKAADEGIALPARVAELIATRIDSNIRDLEGALTRISAFASINHTEINVEMAEKLLLAVAPDAKSELGFDDIEQGVTQHFGLKPEELKARRRTKKVAEARQVAMFLMRRHMGASFPAIGQFMGGRDHSTVVHAYQAVEKRCRADQRYKHMVDTVAKAIGCG